MASPTTQEPTLTILVFSLKTLHLALPLTWVQKIRPLPDVFSSGQNPVGIAVVDDQEVTILDLHQTLYGDARAKTDGYLVIFQAPEHDLYGLPVEQLPTLQQVPLSALRSLPPSYRQGDTLGITSHVALVPQGEATLTVFVLDPDCLYTAVANTGEG